MTEQKYTINCKAEYKCQVSITMENNNNIEDLNRTGLLVITA